MSGLQRFKNALKVAVVEVLGPEVLGPNGPADECRVLWSNPIEDVKVNFTLGKSMVIRSKDPSKLQALLKHVFMNALCAAGSASADPIGEGACGR